MATKSHKKIDSKGHEETWEWEETPELVKAINEWKKTVEDGLKAGQTVSKPST